MGEKQLRLFDRFRGNPQDRGAEAFPYDRVLHQPRKAYIHLRGHDKVTVHFLNFLSFLSHAILLSPAVLSGVTCHTLTDHHAERSGGCT